MHSRIPLFTFLFAIVFLAVPSAAYAAIPFFGPIIPQGANQAVCPASWGLLVTVINNIISLVITLSIVFIAPIMIAYAGFLLVTGTGNPGAVTKARGLILQVVIGIVVMLAAWLIVDAVMAVLYHPSDSTWGTWSSLITSGGISSCLEQRGALPNDTLNQAEINTVAVVPNTNNTVPDYLQENMIRGEFANAGVGINNNSCTAAQMASNGSLCGGTPPPCTNVSGMQNATIDQVIAIAKAVGSTKENKYVVITGGTEPGHACSDKSHQLGFKVDLRPTDAVNKYLENPTMRAGERGGGEPGPIYLDKCRLNQYVLALDPPHWDITINATCIPLK